MASNGRLVTYVLLSILVVVNAGMFHDGEKMVMESYKAPTPFEAGSSSASINRAKFTMNAGSSGTAPGLMTMEKGDGMISVPEDERAYAQKTIEPLLEIVQRDIYPKWMIKDQTIMERRMDQAAAEWLNGWPCEGETQQFEELKQIVSRENFSSEKIEDQSVIDSITEKAVGWLRDRPYEWAYRLFEKLFVSSPNIAIDQLLDQKGETYLVKLGSETALWIQPRNPEKKVMLTLQFTQRQLRQFMTEGLEDQINLALRKALQVQEAQVSQILRDDKVNSRMTSTIDSRMEPRWFNIGAFEKIGELIHPVFESSQMATEDKMRVSAEVLDASLLWKLNNIHLQSFIENCHADRSISPGTCLGIFDPEKKLFLVKINHNTIEWVHPRSPKQTFEFLEHLLEIWQPLIASKELSLEDFTLYLNRLRALLVKLSINENDLNPMPDSLRAQIRGWIIHYSARVNRPKNVIAHS